MPPALSRSTRRSSTEGGKVVCPLGVMHPQLGYVRFPARVRPSILTEMGANWPKAGWLVWHANSGGRPRLALEEGGSNRKSRFRRGKTAQIEYGNRVQYRNAPAGLPHPNPIAEATRLAGAGQRFSALVVLCRNLWPRARSMSRAHRDRRDAKKRLRRPSKRPPSTAALQEVSRQVEFTRVVAR